GQYDRVPEALRRTLAARATLMLTAGSSSIRMFEDGCRQAGAAARALLCMAAAKRWGVAWDACGVAGGFVVHGDKRLRFAALAADAARLTPPDPLPIGMQGAGKLAGRAVPR
ncbi:hypothetical protein ACTGYF_10855, partial [Streptococcus suis]